jgi:low molecular weight phosphotyrosine protein phosphatase
VAISHSARKVQPEDFKDFTHILASDESNLQNLLRMKPGYATAEVKLWGSYDDGKPIADPYYGGMVSNFPFDRSQFQILDYADVVERLRAGVSAMHTILQCIPR